MMKMADEIADEEASDIIVIEDLEKRIKGQSTAVRAVAKSIRRARSGMRDGKTPVANLLFCGPTGVGKVRSLRFFSDVAASSFPLFLIFLELFLIRRNCAKRSPRQTTAKKRIWFALI